MKHTLIFFLLSLSLLGCSANNPTTNSSASKQAKTNEMSERHASFLRGNEEYKKDNFSNAIIHYKKAASEGHYKAKTNLGVIYYNGLGVPKDYKKAFNYFKQVADQSPDIKANYNIAQMYRQGRGVKQDYKQAIINYQIASKIGNIDAKNALGIMYERGLGVDKNLKTARGYYIDAVSEGNSHALNNLGALSHIEGDSKQARQWYEKAAAKGSKKALKNLAVLDAKGL